MTRKSRPDRRGSPELITAVATGAPQSAGDIALWLDQARAGLRKPLGADVPCGACNACCRAGYFVHVRPEDTGALARIPPALLFDAPGLPGHRVMGISAAGHCPMLTGDGCSIYSDRPQTCRDFDCRVFAATGIAAEVADIDAQQARWQFDADSTTASAAQRALQHAGEFLQVHAADFPPDMLPRHPPQLAVLVLKIYQVFMDETEQPAVADRVAQIIATLARFDAPDTSRECCEPVPDP